MKENRTALQRKITAQGALPLLTVKDGEDGPAFDVYFDQQQARVQVVRIDGTDDDKGIDVGPITRKYHSELCDLVQRGVQHLGELVNEAMTDGEAEIAAP